MMTEISDEWEKRDASTPIPVHIVGCAIELNCLAGSIAGMCEHITMLPFDNIKVIITINERLGYKSTPIQVSCKLWHNYSILFYDASKGGIKSFFTGISASSSGCMPAHALQFSVYEVNFHSQWKYSKDHFKLDDEEHHPVEFAIIGVVATIFHDICMTPFDGIYVI